MSTFTIRIHYPAGSGDRIVLRTENDWYGDVEGRPLDSGIFEFRIEAGRSWLEFKPCLRTARDLHWSEGVNKVAHAGRTSSFYPRFRPGVGSVTDVLRVPSPILGRDQALRVFLPAGYDENVLKRYPVLYMHDGRNLFFPEEAFLGREWRVDETLRRLHTMDRIDQTIVVGLHATDRMRDYTAPGYERYGRALVEDVRPWIDAHLRTLTGPQHTGVMGSSLGGVVSFHLAWQHPEAVDIELEQE